jgi:U3 small nucleolar RNA-associated protein 12
VWDLVGECGLFRLKGHKSPIAKAVFMSKLNVLISCGKDMLVKFWDLDTRHCFKTIVSHRSEVNDLILLNEDTRLITGCHDNELRVFELKFNENIEAKIEPNLKKLRIILKPKRQN